jgi:quercetin dioxygenase-like cupin family protein
MAQMAAPTDPNLEPERIDTYKNWQAAHRIPVVRGFFVKERQVGVEPWDLKGTPCSFVVLDGTGGTNDAYVFEIPAGGKTKPQKHLYEEMVYITKGYGATTVWQRNGKKHTFEWGPGRMFAIPLNPIISTSMPQAMTLRAISP